MVPYLLLFAGVAVFGFLLCERHPGKRSDLLFLGVTSAALIVMSAVRGSTVGVDYQPYLDYFKLVCDGGLDFVFSAANGYRTEIGYSLLNYVISLVGSTQVVFAVGISVVCVGLTAWFLYRHAPSVWLGMVVFIGFGFFGYTLCTIRHQIAICIFMLALPYLQRKKLLPYLLIVLLCATFHKSMLVLLPVYFLAQLALDWRAMAVYGGGTVFLLIFSEPIITFITQFVYQSYQVGTYYMMGRDFRTGLVPILLFVLVYLLRKPLLARNPANLPLMNLSLYCALLFIMTFKHFVFQRFALILLPVAIVLLPEMLACFAVPPEKLVELASAKKAAASSEGNKKQANRQYGELRASLKDKRAMYYAAMAATILLCLLYLLFLLAANRLMLVPYVTM